MKFEDMTEEQQAKAALAFFREQQKERVPEVKSKEKVEEKEQAPAEKSNNQLEYDKKRKTVNGQLFYSVILGWAPVHISQMGFKKIAFFRFFLLCCSLFIEPYKGIDIAAICLSVACGWWFCDIFMIHVYVKKYNQSLAKLYGVKWKREDDKKR